MGKTPGNNNKVWSDKDKETLKKLADSNTPTRIIALKMDRTPAAISSQASKLQVSLKPTNQSPYNRKPKS